MVPRAQVKKKRLRVEKTKGLRIITPTKEATSLKMIMAGTKRIRVSLVMFLRRIGSVSSSSPLVKRKKV